MSLSFYSYKTDIKIRSVLTIWDSRPKHLYSKPFQKLDWVVTLEEGHFCLPYTDSLPNLVVRDSWIRKGECSLQGD